MATRTTTTCDNCGVEDSTMRIAQEGTLLDVRLNGQLFGVALRFGADLCAPCMVLAARAWAEAMEDASE